MDIRNRPKAEPVDATKLRAPKREHVVTLKEYITEDESKSWRLVYLRDLTTVSKQPQWMQYLQFIQANISGDMKTFSHENKKYIDKIIKEIEDKRTTESSGV